MTPPGPAVDERTPVWALGRRRLTLGEPLLIGILNVTPDSFSDGGLHMDPAAAARRAAEMVEEGAAMIDVGGESTRPGAEPVPVEIEKERVLPVIRRLKAELDVPISIDTRRAEVAEAALAENAEVVNDVSALADPGMGDVVAKAGAGLVLMHMRGIPRTMQINPTYEDVVGEVADELNGALDRAISAGVDPEHVVLDPGIGFGKTFQHNLQLLGEIDVLARLRRPVVLGVSRKSFLGQILGGAPPTERAIATAAACVAAVLRGVRIFRVHDVKTVRDAVLVAEAIRIASPAS